MAQVAVAGSSAPTMPTVSTPSSNSSRSSSEERPAYNNKMELMLTLVGYAVGLGNVWRFPYLAYTCGGGAFLIPYVVALLFLGLPLFILELGLGQMMRQGTLGVWAKLGLPRLQSVGVTATVVTFCVSLYYNVILAWTIYYIGRTFASIGGPLPWTDEVAGFQCKERVLIANASMAHDVLIHEATGLYNHEHESAFWCPPSPAIPDMSTEVPAGYVRMLVAPKSCPAFAAAQFWETEVLQQSSGMDDLGGFHPGMLIAYTAAWLLVYGCICKGIASSGKVVYVTATLPYVALIAFSFRANSLPNSSAGSIFFISPDFSLLSDPSVWLRAVIQIFYSLGVGFGSIIAFASYGPVNSNFSKDAVVISVINCGTSIFAGFVVFPILGFLALELSETDPCMRADDLAGLASVGLSGTGLAFIAFPIAISQMTGSFFWALLFFFMLLCLGIDSQFAMCESVVTVLSDAGVDKWLSRKLGCKVTKERFVVGYCFISYVMGLIFCTRAGVYWFNLFDYYSCVIGLFFVTFLECVGLMWMSARDTYPNFRLAVMTNTGMTLGCGYWLMWKFVVPLLLLVIASSALTTFDLMGAEESVPYPEGSGYLPPWSIVAGWCLGLLPLVGFIVSVLACGRAPKKEDSGGGKRPAALAGSSLGQEKAAGGSSSSSAQAAEDHKVRTKRTNTLDGLTEFRGPEVRESAVAETTQDIRLDLAPMSGAAGAAAKRAELAAGSRRGIMADLKYAEPGEAAKAGVAPEGLPAAARAGALEPSRSARGSRLLVKCGPWTCIQ